jgi:hypothetical protein
MPEAIPKLEPGRRSRSHNDLKVPLERKLAAYATAAGAAGVAMLAVPFAEAKIVYTPANVTIPGNSTYSLDLNHDGIADFSIIRVGNMLPHASILEVGLPVTENAVRSTNNFRSEAAALVLGAPIGPKQRFTAHTSGYGGVWMADAGEYGTSYSNGAWADKKALSRAGVPR